MFGIFLKYKHYLMLFNNNVYIYTSMAANSKGELNTPSTKRGLQKGYDRVTFIVKDEIAYKLNCIASIDDVYIKDVVNTALGKFIDEWEKKNGKLNKQKSTKKYDI